MHQNPKPYRYVVHANALHWLGTQDDNGVIITSLPDLSELQTDREGWENFTRAACEALIFSLKETGIIFFYQTDRKYQGITIDKKSFISNIFHSYGFETIMSKIVLKQAPETSNLFRPTFTNLFAFSKEIKSGKPTPDVIYGGKMIYKNAMGFNACAVCLDFLKSKGYDSETVIVDPFCGQGSILKMANDAGFNSIGVDIDINQTKKAELL